MNASISKFPWGIVKCLDGSFFHVATRPAFKSLSCLSQKCHKCFMWSLTGCSLTISGRGGGRLHSPRLQTVILKVTTLKSFCWFLFLSFFKLKFPYNCFCCLQTSIQRKTERDSGNYSNRVQTPTVCQLRLSSISMSTLMIKEGHRSKRLEQKGNTKNLQQKCFNLFF